MTLPSPQPKLTPYLTIIPTRRPQQKTHSNIGHAKNAISNKINAYRVGAECDMQMFEHVDGGWKLLYDIKRGDLEPPWRAGELEELRQKEIRAKEAKEKQVDAKSRKLGADLYDNVWDSEPYPFHREHFIAAYSSGYKEARKEYKR